MNREKLSQLREDVLDFKKTYTKIVEEEQKNDGHLAMSAQVGQVTLMFLERIIDIMSDGEDGLGGKRE